MVSRPTLARIAVGILLGVVLGVVLHESNTRTIPQNLRAVVTNSTATSVALSEGSCNGAGVNCGDGSGCCPGLDCNPSNDTCEPMSSSSEPWYICACGGCVSSGFGTPGEWGNATHDPMCGSTCGDQMGWPPECFPSSSSSSCQALGDVCGGGYGDCCAPAYCDNQSDYGYCVTSSSSSQPQYCCSGAGLCEQVYLGLTTCIGAETTDSTCGGGCSSASSVTNYCCNVVTHTCEVSSSSSSAP